MYLLVNINMEIFSEKQQRAVFCQTCSKYFWIRKEMIKLVFLLLLELSV